MTTHWVSNPSASPECGCGWIPTEADIIAAGNDTLTAVEIHVTNLATEPDVVVKDQDERSLTVTGTYKGFGATVVCVEVDKPPEPVDAAETTLVFQAAVLGMQLQPPDARRIGIDIHNEIDRMGFALIRKEPKRS